MSHIFSNQIRVIQNNFSSISFTNNLYNQLDEGLFNVVKSFIEKNVPQSAVEFIEEAGWLGSGYHILFIGSKLFRVGAFLQNSTSCLVVEIDTYARQANSAKRKTVVRNISFPGFVTGIQVHICNELAMDTEELADQIENCFLTVGRSATVDFRSTLMDYTLNSGSDRLYDVIRRSTLHTLMPAISLYVVYENLGRHLPSYNRLDEIVKRMNESIYGTVACPFQLAGNFFLHHLDGKQSDLYTQKAFKLGMTLFAEKDKYSGYRSELASKMATEAFFGNETVAVQPLVKSGDDKMLISAIYPAHLHFFLEKKLKDLIPHFEKQLEENEKIKRSALGKLATMGKPTGPMEDYLLKFVTMFGGFCRGFFVE